MKLVTFRIDAATGPIIRIGAMGDQRIVDLAAAYAMVLGDNGVHAADELAQAMFPPDMAAFLSRWPLGKEIAESTLAFASRLPPDTLSPAGARIWYAPGQYRLNAALRPRRIRDYLTFEEHKKKAVARRGQTMPELWYQIPCYTNRNSAGLANPEDDIAWPSYSEKLDFEFEIGLVIGKVGRDIPPDKAGAYIAGFTIYNDFSARDYQMTESKIGAGPGKSKDFDQGNVLGPCIATFDEIDGGNIDMILRVNGEEWARGNTNRMKFSWGQIIENASRGETIYPGDVLASGTMDRGCCIELEKWFEPGAVIEMEAKGIGILRNRVIRPRA